MSTVSLFLGLSLALSESTASGSLVGVDQKTDVPRSSFNCILYGIPNLVIEWHTWIPP